MAGSAGWLCRVLCAEGGSDRPLSGRLDPPGRDLARDARRLPRDADDRLGEHFLCAKIGMLRADFRRKTVPAFELQRFVALPQFDLEVLRDYIVQRGETDTVLFLRDLLRPVRAIAEMFPIHEARLLRIALDDLVNRPRAQVMAAPGVIIRMAKNDPATRPQERGKLGER